MIKILDLAPENNQSFCDDLPAELQEDVQGGSWLGDAFRWALDHIGISVSGGGGTVSYKGRF